MKYFLSVPFSSRIDEAGFVQAEYRALIEQILSQLRSVGHDVFCALEHAEWKMGGNGTPEEEFAKDLAEIDACDKVISLLEERVSAGVQLEMGYAYARGKQLDLFQIGKAAWSNATFAKLNGQEIIGVSEIDDFVRQVIAREKASN